MSKPGPFTFLYAEQADPSYGPLALLPGFRPCFTNRGLPDLLRDEERCVPGVIWPGVPPPPESPFKGDQATAVLVDPGEFEAVLPVLIRRQRRDPQSTSASRELMEAVRLSAEACGFPYDVIIAITNGFGAQVGYIGTHIGFADGQRADHIAADTGREIFLF